jgi:hypothetical protein
MTTFADIVEALPEATRARLLEARGARIDPTKVISASEQVLRVLAALPRERLSTLGATARLALDRLVPAPGRLPRHELGGGALALVEAGLAFAVDDDVVCPAALRVQLPSAPGEDPRSARALYSRLGEDVMRVLHHGALRSRSGGPRAVAVGELLEEVESVWALTKRIEALPHGERVALAAIEARGGEVSRDGLLALAREPARYAAGAGLPLRGIAQSLLAGGLVVPVSHDRYVIPTEIARVVGRERRDVLARRNAEVRARIDANEDDAHRATLAVDPGPLALALIAELTASGELARSDRPVSRSALARAATSLHVAVDHADLLVALGRSEGLRTARVGEVGARLVALYRASSVGDETRLHPARPTRRLGATGIVAMRELVLDTLAALPRGRFVAGSDVVTAAKSDLRAEGIELGLRELGRLAPTDVSPSLDRALDRIASVSLPALGLVDRAPDGSLRLAARAMRSSAPVGDEVLPSWDGGRARFGDGCAVRHVLALAPIARPAVDDGLVLVLDPMRAAPLRVDRDVLASSLDAAGCPRSIADAALAALPSARATLAASEPVRWIPIGEPDLRAQLLDDPAIARIVLPESPAEGLLVHAHGTFPRLARMFARHGVDLRKLA